MENKKDTRTIVQSCSKDASLGTSENVASWNRD